jgi:glycosyltransferase involved in cell wall biosynthesis
MRIGILGPFEPFRGGIAQFGHNLVNELNNYHEVVMFNFLKQYPDLIFPGKKQITNSQDIVGDRVLIPYNPFTWKRSAESIIEKKINVLIIQFWIPFFCPAYTSLIKHLKKNSEIKVHLICHNIEFHEKWLFSGKLLKKMLKLADNVIYLSSTVAKAANCYRLQNETVLFHPLYDVQQRTDKENSFKKLNLPSKKTILFFGFIKKYKGLDILLKAYQKVYQQQKDIQLVIAGEIYGNRKVYDRIIGSFESEVQDNIYLHNDFISDEIVADYFTIADVLIAPYRTSSQSGIVQLAYSYNIPVIVSDSEGLKEMVKAGETGEIFFNENIDDLSEKILTFFAKEADYKRNIVSLNRLCNWREFVILLEKKINL